MSYQERKVATFDKGVVPKLLTLDDISEVQYLKIEGLETASKFMSIAMLNLFEDVAVTPPNPGGGDQGGNQPGPGQNPGGDQSNPNQPGNPGTPNQPGQNPGGSQTPPSGGGQDNSNKPHKPGDNQAAPDGKNQNGGQALTPRPPQSPQPNHRPRPQTSQSIAQRPNTGRQAESAPTDTSSSSTTDQQSNTKTESTPVPADPISKPDNQQPATPKTEASAPSQAIKPQSDQSMIWLIMSVSTGVLVTSGGVIFVVTRKRH